ncbi:hypothetical protein ATCC90586_010872 [Pythium insidiosum]|nr:hypothetical protein ATCC90586_010872 [Pythium insidiosum]
MERRRPLRVVVADDHHHVLPELHLAIRQRLLPFHGVHIVHIDAHPDLSFPADADPQRVVFEPDLLYDTLDASVSGIAEFLLPLVYAGHVNRLTWIKSPWASQMTTGVMTGIAIGRHRETHKLQVSCPWPHFVDEKLYAPEDELEPPTRRYWDLEVQELSVDQRSPMASPPWVLDIDLDFFSTWNPFRRDLERHFSPSEMGVLTAVFTTPRFRRVDVDLLPTQRQRERASFEDVMRRLADRQADDDGGASIAGLLLPFYDDLTSSTVHAFLSLLSRHRENADALALLWATAPLLDLPHHESQLDEMEQLLASLRSWLHRHKHSPPAIVTIATSVGDEFLPPPQADALLKQVLAIIEELLGPIEVRRVEYEQQDQEQEQVTA